MSSEDEKSRYCLHCSKKLTYQKRYCSIQCIGLYKQNSNYVKRGEYRHKCSECNQKFIGSFKSQYCSYSCRHMQPAKSKLSYERLLTSEVQEVLDGYLLGDGFLGQEGNRSGRLTIQQQHKEFAQYIANFFEMYFEPDKAIVKYGKKEDDRLKSGYSEFYRIRTLSHPDLLEQRKRWYPGDRKIVPRDISLTPLCCLVWYLSDGCLVRRKLPRKERPIITIATNSFDPNDLTVLNNELQCRIGVTTSITQSNELRLNYGNACKFLNYIGKSPVKCYSYKWMTQKEREWTTKLGRRYNYALIIRKYEQGMTVKSICRELGCCSVTAYKALRPLCLSKIH